MKCSSRTEATTNDILKTLSYLHPNGSTFEICGIGPKNRKLSLWGGEYAGGQKPIVAGWSGDQKNAARIIDELDRRGMPAGIYTTLNPCNPALMSRANNRLKAGVGRTQDAEIERLQNLLIDADPKRPSGISATEIEKAEALDVIRAVWRDLNIRGWPEPLAGDSGNGGHLVYKIDLDNAPENVEVLKGVLAALSEKFSTETVDIDTTVYNPARISKVYGTTTRKGDHTDDRPHRRAKILSLPNDPQPVPIELLKALAAEARPKESRPKVIQNGSPSYNRLDVPAYLSRYGVEIARTKPNGSGTLYVLKQCVFNPDHTSGEAAIGQAADGMLTYQCFHNSCRGMTWHDAKRLISGDDRLFESAPRVQNQGSSIAANHDVTANQEPAEWDRARELYPRLSFPWRVLPADISASLQQLARSHATSPLSLPGAAITIFASVLGSTVSVSPKQSWREPLIIWVVDIRPSGSGKTGPGRALCLVLYLAQTQVDQEYRAKKDEWNARKKKDKGPAPARAKSYFITDLTVEGVRHEMQGNRNGGAVAIYDELSSFLSAQNQYKSKGNDRESWLCLHDGNPLRVVRATESFTVSGARISIFGGIQPHVWRTIFGGDKGLYLADGTVYRFLPTFENDRSFPLTTESWADSNRKAWEQPLTLAMEWAGEIAKAEGWKAKCLCLDQDAQAFFFDWCNRLNESKSELPDQLKGFIPKSIGYALRLSGVLYCMRQFSAGSYPGAVMTLDDIRRGTDAAMFYMGHIVDATRALCSKDCITPTEMNHQTEHLAETLGALRDNVDSGRLAVGFIQKQFDQDLPPEKRVNSPRVMGTLLRQCGLTIPTRRFRINDKTGLACLMWDQKTESFLKTHQHHQHRQQAADDAGSQVLTKENGRQQCQHPHPAESPNVDDVDQKNPTSTPVSPRQSRAVANVDDVDEISTEKEKKETVTI